MAIASIWTLETTYRLQIKDRDGVWNDYSQAEYETATEVHWTAQQIYGGLAPDQYRLVEISRKIIEN